MEQFMGIPFIALSCSKPTICLEICSQVSADVGDLPNVWHANFCAFRQAVEREIIYAQREAAPGFLFSASLTKTPTFLCCSLQQGNKVEQLLLFG